MQPASATSELVLPGLDSPEPMTQPVPGHWIERGPVWTPLIGTLSARGTLATLCSILPARSQTSTSLGKSRWP